ncbi:CPBP family intramembrane glutamic endopeptidase [Desertivirga arenae]|uniref:CPBP family intramembrane glutamic endopeptidase n=1 Tax=Desertivirga arenae TaxID=2810309 RepID=UPI001A95C51D|nr:CPBP family intramembrane glutamic endopeptidase [Pedobacter sp. SYSU D00823]
MAIFCTIPTFFLSGSYKEFVRLTTATVYNSVVAIYLWKKFNLTFTPVRSVQVGYGLVCGILLFLSVSTMKNFILPFQYLDINNQLPLSPILLSILIAPIYEEIIFRGVLLKEVLVVNNTFFRLLFISILFALFHLSFPFDTRALLNFTGHIFAGIVFGYIYLKSGNLLTSIIAHSVTNISAVLLTTTIIPTMNPINSLVFFCISLSTLWLILFRMKVT